MKNNRFENLVLASGDNFVFVSLENDYNAEVIQYRIDYSIHEY